MYDVRCYLARVSAQTATVGGQECTFYAVEASQNGEAWEALTVHRTRDSAEAELARLCSLDTGGATRVFYFSAQEPELDWTAFFEKNKK